MRSARAGSRPHLKTFFLKRTTEGMRRKACAATVKGRVARDNAKKGMGEEKTKGHEGRARGRGVALNTHLPGAGQ